MRRRWIRLWLSRNSELAYCRKLDSLVLCNAMNKVLDVKLHACFSGFCDTWDFYRAILPHQDKFNLSLDMTYKENFIQCSRCSEGFKSVTKTHCVSSACSWCPLSKSYIWCIKHLWYSRSSSVMKLWNHFFYTKQVLKIWLRRLLGLVCLFSFTARILPFPY